MDVKIIYRFCIILGTVTYTAYFFLPYTYGYLDSDTGNLLSYSGYGAMFQGNAVIEYIIFTAWLMCALGMFFFYKIARTAFVFLLVSTTALVPLFGASVETAGGTLLLDITNITDGFILALAFFSPIRNEFKS